MTVRRLEDAVRKNELSVIPEWQPVIENGIFCGLRSKRGEYGLLSVAEDCNQYDKPFVAERGFPNNGSEAIKSGSIVVPYLIDDENILVHMVEVNRDVVYNPQKRQLGIRSLEIPRGFKDVNETTLATAYRELFEETGLSPISVTQLLGSDDNMGIVPNTGNTVNSADIYVGQVGWQQTNTPDSDIISNRFLNYRSVRNLVRENQICCGLSLGALFAFDCYLEKNHPQEYIVTISG